MLSARRSDASAELKGLVRELRESSLESARDDFLEALSLLNVDELTHDDVTAVTRRYGLQSIPHADSFWRSIVGRRRKKQLGKVPETYLGIRKDHDEEFAESVGVRTATTVYRGAFPESPGADSDLVLKPVRSSDAIGAYYILGDRLFSIEESVELDDWATLKAHAHRTACKSADGAGEWELQDLVLLNERPAPDLKFYCFYGEIGVVLEVSRYPEWRYAYFDGSLSPIDLRNESRPAFKSLSDTSVYGNGLSEENLEIVRSLSLEIPVPFMRLDFLNSDDGLVFCEFSSAPGASHDLTRIEDERLGTMYHSAEVRLVSDLLGGKKFLPYKNSGRSSLSSMSSSDVDAVAGPQAGVDLRDYKWYLRDGRRLLKEGYQADAERHLRRSLELNFNIWAVKTLGELFIAAGRLDALHSLEDVVIDRLGDRWERPESFPPRRMTDRQLADAGEPLLTALPAGAESAAFLVRGRLLPGEHSVLMDRDGYKITFRRAMYDSSVLMIAFGAANSGLSQHGFASDVASSLEYDYIYVAQRPGTQYQELPLNEFFQSVGPFCGLYDKVLAYGSSLGAYCAFYYGGSVNAQIISSAPRNSAHPIISHKRYEDLLYRHANIYEAPSSSLDPVVLIDPTMRVDGQFLKEMIRPAYGNVRLLEVPYSGHAVLLALREAGVLKRLLTSLVDRDHLIDVEWGGSASTIWLRERGRYLVEEERWDEAEEVLRGSLAREFDKKAAYNLAVVYQRTRRTDQLLGFHDRIMDELGTVEFLPPSVTRTVERARGGFEGGA